HGYRQSDFALGCLQTAAIVFDEIHCYDRQMLSELRELFNLLRILKIPHIVMSGTLPNFIIKETGIQDYHTVIDKEGLSFKPFILRKREYPMFIKAENNAYIPDKSVIKEVIDGFNEGLRQFVIVNTVRKAQAIYRAISEKIGSSDKLYCLHSRFCYIHRINKEKELLEKLKQGVKPLILVATQVIEVSLDISCDRMFTELAPPDALGQRGGRLNRGAKEPDNHELIIFPIEDPNPYLIPHERKPLPELEKTLQNLQDNIISSYDWLKNLCNIVYENKKLSTAYLGELFKKCTLFGLNYEEIRFSEEEGKAYRPRDIAMPTIDVIPESVISNLNNRAPDLIYFLVPVPIWWLKKSTAEKLNLFYTHKVEDRDWLVCKITYHEDIGFEEEKIGAPLD
ncbi:MAG: CRISPR-associated helicase Cas3', partial [candidate division WOR-3 bacterium]